jgi:hypothetical protein
LKRLSIQHRLTTGKWLISVPWDECDRIWSTVKTAFVENKLPDDVRYIKVGLLSFHLFGISQNKTELTFFIPQSSCV